MENKKSNTGLIVTIVVLVMLLLFGGTLFVLSSMGYLSFDDESVKEQEYVDSNNDNNIVENKVDNDKVYAFVIEEYREYINNLDYKSENINNSDSYIVANGDFNIGYSYYDFDKNGIDELLISQGDNGKIANIIDLYTFNENNVVKIIDKSGVCQRCSISIWDNGVLFYRGSGGASHGYLHFYNISSASVDRYIYEYDEELNFSVYKTDENGTKIGAKLDYSSDEKLITEYRKNASLLSLDTINWDEIK